LNKRKYFLQQFFKEKKTVGAVSPSSRYLKNKMLENIDFENSRVIVEFGPGTGVFTREIVRKMHNDCKLIVIELNDSFFTKIQTEFNDESRVILEKTSAEKLLEILERHGLDKVDFIVSSLPLAIFPKELTDNILLTSRQALRSNGKYIQFQYSLKSKRRLNHFFNKIDITFTARNIPPAFVYCCSSEE
jgi:phosphatidylethanolamine/phosphatidyl-N-methylethanolamine N-methyltransferase